jgi:photosystem II stability/assembly factor-like uncharacterized protein
MICFPLLLQAQHIIVLDSGNRISLRGLSVVHDDLFWVSGNKGTLARCTEGGKKIEWMKVAGFENRDFRDIEAFDHETAIIMAIDSPALILKTKDSGKSWDKVFEDHRSGMFLDAMHFHNKKKGVVVGDPIDGRFFLARTDDGGESWQSLKINARPLADSGEALFAASGSNIMRNKGGYFFISGGMSSHLIQGTHKIRLPLAQGKSSKGANSFDMASDGRIIITGGDFYADTVSVGNCIITDDQGKTFQYPTTPPFGYKSSVAWIADHIWVACGTSGVDISYDHGLNWKNISRQSFNTIQKSKKGKKIILTGRNGTIAELVFPK